MIDAVYVFLDSGLLLWSLDLVALDQNFANIYVMEVVMKGRLSDSSFSSFGKILKWKYLAQIGATVLLVYDVKAPDERFVEALLSPFAQKVLEKVEVSPGALSVDLSKEFDSCVGQAFSAKHGAKAQKQAPVVDSSGAAKREELKNKQRDWGIEGSGGSISSGKTKSKAKEQKLLDELDYSKKVVSSSKEKEPETNQRAEKKSSGKKDSSTKTAAIPTPTNPEKTKDLKGKAKDSSLLSSLSSRVLDIFGKESPNLSEVEISESMLAPVLDTLRSTMVERNVHPEVVEKLVESVSLTLCGKKVGDLDSQADPKRSAAKGSGQGFLASIAGKLRLAKRNEAADLLTEHLRQTMKGTIDRILTAPKLDIVEDIQSHLKGTKSRSSGSADHGPYVLVLGGVNGVGKSTTLAKFVHLVKRKVAEANILVVAADTFRSGAVEQLEIHTKKLGVELFQRGYGKDPAEVAKQAVQYATSSGKINVVFIDTAGRMQGNTALMKNLEQLVSFCKPNRILLVGETITGSDIVDQVEKFGEAIQPRHLDGTVLTKFDAAGEKVGAALSLVYSSKVPVAYIGTGQTYEDLSLFDPELVSNALLD